MNSSHRPKASRAHPTPSFLAIRDDGTRHRVSDRELAKHMRQARTVTLKRLRQSRAETLAAVADKIEDERIRRNFEAAEQDLDAAIRRFHKRVWVQPELHRRAPAARKRKATVAGTGHSGLVLKARPHSSLGYRPPAPETATLPWPASGSASLHPCPAMAKEATIH